MPTPSRYDTSGYASVEGRTYHTLRPLADTALRPDDRYYTVQAGDDLQRLGWQLLGNAALWWVLADYNNVLSPFDALVAGAILRYPSRVHLLLTVLA